jgi:phage terminase large subunit
MAQATITAEEFDTLQAYYLKHPEEFVTDILGAKPWQMQVDIIRSVFKNKITAVKTCNAVGKSFIAAHIVIAYLMLHPDSIVVTTAPTWSQVTDVLWREIRTAVKLAKYKLTDAEVNQAGLSLGEKWYAVGRSTNRPENFFGYHADHILVVVDEAGGVDEPIFKGVAAITPNINARVLLIGNPTNPSGTFFDYFDKPELGAKCFTISAFDSPNFTALNIKTVDDLITMYKPRDGWDQVDWISRVNDVISKRLDPTYQSLIDPATVYGRYYEWGADSAAWQALIMGEFPTQAEQQLIPTDLVMMAMNMNGIDPDSGQTYAELSGWDISDGMPEYGLDMARYGSDSTVLTPRHGGWVEGQIAWTKTDLMTSAHKVLAVIDQLNPDLRLDIDDTGNGGGTTDRLREIGTIDQRKVGKPVHQYQLAAYNFSSKEMMSDADRDKFHDVTSMLYWNLRSWFYAHAIALPNDMQLRDELIARRWSILPNGKIKVESKDEYKKRTGGKSPDRSDSLALAFAGGKRIMYEPVAPSSARPYVPQRKPFTSGLKHGGW